MGTQHTGAVLGDAPGDAAPRAPRGRIRVDVREAGDVVRLQRAIGDAAGAEGNREHRRLGRKHTAAPRHDLRLADGGVPEPEQMSDLVKRDGLEVVTAGFPCGRYRPGERRVEEDVRLDYLSRCHVDDEVGRRQDALQIRTAGEAQHRHAIAACG